MSADTHPSGRHMKLQPTLATAAALTDRHMGRLVKIGRIEGELTGLNTTSDYVVITLAIGTNRARAEFRLLPGAHVEHRRAEG